MSKLSIEIKNKLRQRSQSHYSILHFILLFLSATIFTFLPSQAQGEEITREIEIPWGGHELVYSPINAKIYIRQTTTAFSSYSTNTLTQGPTIALDEGIQTLFLSSDETRLYAKLFRAGAIATIDLETEEVAYHDFSEDLGDAALIWSTVELEPHVLLASIRNNSIPESYSFAKLTFPPLVESPQVEKILEDYDTSSCGAVLTKSPQGDVLYLTTCETETNIFKLDLTQPDFPLISSSFIPSLTFRGQQGLTIHPEGSRLYTSGRIVDPTTFETLDFLPSRGIRFGDNPDIYYSISNESRDKIDVYSSTTYKKVAQIDSPCNSIERIEAYVVLNENRGVIVKEHRTLCGTIQVQECTEPPPTPTLTFPNAESIVDGFAPGTFTWSLPELTCPYTFDVILDQNNPPTSIFARDLEDLRYNPGQLSSGTYYLKIVAKNSQGETESEVVSFEATGVSPSPSDYVMSLIGFSRSPSVSTDLVYDSLRNIVYVSMPILDEIWRISLDGDGVFLSRIINLDSPRGIELSSTGDSLYVALGHELTIAEIDLDSLEITRHSLSNESSILEGIDGGVLDVVEGNPGELYVTVTSGSSPSSNGVYKFNEAQDNQVTRIGEDLLASCRPEIEIDRAQNLLYLYQCSSVGGLKVLDLNTPTGEVVREKAMQLPTITETRFSISPDGARVFLPDGQVLNSTTLELEKSIEGRFAKADEANGRILTFIEPDTVKIYNNQDLSFQSDFKLTTEIRSLRSFFLIPEIDEWIFLDHRGMHRVSPVPDCTSPFPNLNVHTPADGAHLELPNSGTLSWSLTEDPTCPVTFDVFWGSQSPPQYLLCRNSSELSCELEDLSEGSYFWQVVMNTHEGTIEGPIWSFEVSEPYNTPSVSPQFNFEADTFDFAVDQTRQRVYVSTPNLNEVQILELPYFQALDPIKVDHKPNGLELSSNGSYLYVAQKDAASFAIIHLEDNSISEIDLAEDLDGSFAYDVSEGLPGQLIVTSHGNAFHQTRFVVVDLDGDQVLNTTRSANTLRNYATVQISPDGHFAYAYACDDQKVAYKLDLQQEGAPIDRISPINDFVNCSEQSPHFALSGDGSFLSLPSGFALNTDDFSSIHRQATGAKSFGLRNDIYWWSPTSEIIYSVAIPMETISIVDANPYSQQVRPSFTHKIEVLADAQGWILIAGNTIRGIIHGESCPDLPEEPYQPDPPHPSTEISLTHVNLSWEGSPDYCASRYSVYLDTFDPPESIISYNRPLTEAFVGGLEPDTTYYWQVRSQRGGREIESPVWSFTTRSDSSRITQPINFDLGSIGGKMVFADSRKTLFISLPSENSILLYSTFKLDAIDQIQLQNRPAGICLSHDENALYVALSDELSILKIQLDSQEIQRLDIGSESGSGYPHGLIEVSPNKVAISFEPERDEESHLLLFDVNTRETQIIAEGRKFLDPASFVQSGDLRFLFVGFPNEILKLDISQEGLPIVDSETESVFFGDQFSISADSAQLYLANGAIHETSSLEEWSPARKRGIPSFGDRSAVAYIATNDEIQVIHLPEQEVVGSMPLECSEGSPDEYLTHDFIALPTEQGFLALKGPYLCGYLSKNPEDCNSNGISDAEEIAEGLVQDENLNSIPDSCERPIFRRADVNSDGKIEITDVVNGLSYLFIGLSPEPTCLKSLDVNDDALIDVSDPIYLLSYMFLGKDAPPAPFIECGHDPSLDHLGCPLTHECF